MAYLNAIIDSIEKKYNLKINGFYQPKYHINGVKFLNNNDINIAHLTPNVLYLADYQQYGHDDVYGHVLYVNYQSGKKLDNCLYIIETIDLIDLYNVIEEQILAFQQVSYNISTLFHVLHNGRGLNTMLKTAYKMIQNPIVICDSSYTVLDSYPAIEDNRNLEIRNRRLSLKEVFTENMISEKITDRIYHSVYPFVTKVEDYPYDWIFESIRIKRAVVGYLCIRCIEKKCVPNDLEIIHSLSQMISIQLQKDDTYENPESFKYDLFFKELLSRQLDKEIALKNLQLLGVKPEKYYYIVSCAFTEKSYKLMSLNYYWQQLTAIFSNSITAVLGNRFVSLVSTDQFETLNKKRKDRLASFLTMNHMIACVSYIFDNLWDTVAYVEQSNTILSSYLSSYVDYPIIDFKDNYLKYIATTINNHELIYSIIHPSIKKMREYDKIHHSDYYETIVTYFKNNRSAPATAKSLFIHKSTLFYRFDKMKQLFLIDLTNQDYLFAYEFSIKLLEILN